MGMPTMRHAYRSSNYHTVIPGCIMRLQKEGLATAVSVSDSPQTQLLNPPRLVRDVWDQNIPLDPLSYHPIVVSGTEGERGHEVIAFAVITDIDPAPLRRHRKHPVLKDLLSNFNTLRVPIPNVRVITPYIVDQHYGKDLYSKLEFNMHLAPEVYTIPAKDVVNFELHFGCRPYKYRLQKESYVEAVKLFPDFKEQKFIATNEVLPNLTQNWRRE